MYTYVCVFLNTPGGPGEDPARPTAHLQPTKPGSIKKEHLQSPSSKALKGAIDGHSWGNPRPTVSRSGHSVNMGGWAGTPRRLGKCRAIFLWNMGNQWAIRRQSWTKMGNTAFWVGHRHRKHWSRVGSKSDRRPTTLVLIGAGGRFRSKLTESIL